jgi:hypothetical protein
MRKKNIKIMKYNYYFGRQLKFNKYFSTIINKKNKNKKDNSSR